MIRKVILTALIGLAFGTVPSAAQTTDEQTPLCYECKVGGPKNTLIAGQGQILGTLAVSLTRLPVQLERHAAVHFEHCRSNRMDPLTLGCPA